MLGCNAEVPLGVDIVEQQKVICGMEGLNGRDAEALDDEFAPLVPLAREWGFFYFRGCNSRSEKHPPRARPRPAQTGFRVSGSLPITSIRLGVQTPSRDDFTIRN